MSTLQALKPLIVKSIFLFDDESRLSKEVENILLLTKQVFSPVAARPHSHATYLLNSFAKDIVQSNIS